MAQPGKLENESLNPSGPLAGAGGLVVAADGPIMVEKIATVALNAFDAVISDEGTGPDNVTKSAANDSTARYGIAAHAAALGAKVWIVIAGRTKAIAGAAIAAGAIVATSNTAAGQVKTAAAAGGRTNLGRALSAAAGAASVFDIEIDRA